MLAAAQGRDDVTQALLAVGGAQDVVDAGHDGGDVGDVAAVVHGGCNDNGDQMIRLEIVIFQFVSGCQGVLKMFLLTVNLIVTSQGLLEGTAGPG